MESLLNTLEKTSLTGDNSLFNNIIRKAFDNAKTKEEAEIVAALAHKYQLPCLDNILNDLDSISDLPF